MDAFVFIFILVGVLGFALFLVTLHLERKRREALAAVAASLGLSFSPDRNHNIARKFESLRGMKQGSNRYAFHVMAGTHRGQKVTIFDHHHETTSTNSEGKRTTHHHYRHLILLHLDREFPNLFIAREGIFSKIAQAAGYDDIDFESHEFSRRFCVRSSDKKFAYDFCNALMIDFLLSHSDLDLETHFSVLASSYDGKMNPATIASDLDLVCSVRELMPAYLFETA